MKPLKTPVRDLSVSVIVCRPERRLVGISEGMIPVPLEGELLVLKSPGPMPAVEPEARSCETEGKSKIVASHGSRKQTEKGQRRA
jgi:hypothetical protein